MIVMTIKLGNGGFMNDDSAMDLQKEARKREKITRNRMKIT
jgi:hypothetical protein